MQRKVITRSCIPSNNVSRASAMRACPSPAEEALWQALRRGQLGVRFVRQACIGRYIVDFFAPAASLVVEVDGAYHLRTKRADDSRTRKLNRAGYRVLRFSNEQVLDGLPEVVARIGDALIAKLVSPHR